MPTTSLCAILYCLPLLLLTSIAPAAAPDDQPRPNILWITIEDWGPDLSCYGTPGISTPHVDKLAQEGVRFETAFSTAPVCSPSRSAMMTGFHQNYIGAHQHRTKDKKPLPFGIRPIPKLFEAAGYYTTLMSWKTDLNFLPDKKQELFMDTKDWTGRAKDQPFFARITFADTHRAWSRDSIRPIAIGDVVLPPYYADTPFNCRDWANGLEQMQLVDRQVGALLQRLEDEGLAENTLVVFTADHGRCHIRGKQFLYDGGIRIPMIVRWPGEVEAGRVSGDLVTTLDICATVLKAAGIVPPIPLHGADLFGTAVKEREYIFSARDKMDKTHDAMRAVRSKNYKLILNLMPERPWLQFSDYKEGAYPMLAEMNVLHLEGKLTEEQALFFASTKPPIELFDLRKDPHELKNVADDPAYASVKKNMMEALDTWRKDVIIDQGVSEEFRALGIFPAGNPVAAVDEWSNENKDDYDFETNGLPAWFPTRSLEQWRKKREIWQPYVMRAPNVRMQRPWITVSQKIDKKKTIR